MTLLSERLDHEWAVMSRRPRLIEHARSWELDGAPFSDLDGLLRAAGHFTPSTPEANDVLLRLVELARIDDLAARVVLQRILPGLLANSRRRRVFGDTEAFEEIVGAAWIVIRTFRADRRRGLVAVNLVRDSAYRAFTGPARRRWSSELATNPLSFDDRLADDTESSCDELARVLVEAEQAGVPESDVSLVRQLVRSGSRAVAAERKISMRTVRNHRDRAAARIREADRAA